MKKFPLVGQYLSIQLDIPLEEIDPGEICVVETARRTRCEQSYGYIHAMYGIWFEDGRTAISVPPGAGEGIRKLLAKAGHPAPSFETGLINDITRIISEALVRQGFPPVHKTGKQLLFGCNASLLRQWEMGKCVRLVNGSIPAAEGLCLPTHCFPERSNLRPPRWVF